MVTVEDKDVVLNATTSANDQIGAGSCQKIHEEAFNSPVMCISEEILEPLPSKTKVTKRKGKRLTQICVK